MDQKILREYLIALGFRVDQTGEKRVDNLLGRMDKKALGVGKSLLGIASSVVTATTVFARQMERMFYASRYADTTVSNLQALEYGTRNIGLEAGKGAAALRNMTASIRANPGLIGLLNSIGVPVKGRDKADVLIDLVAALKKMPFYIAERYANLFGIPAEDLFNMQEGLDKMKEAAAARKQMAEEMGVDVDQSAQIAREYMGLWREVTERAKLFGVVLGTWALPYVKELVVETNTLMVKWASIVKNLQQPGGGEEFWRRLQEGLTGKAQGERVTLTPEARARLGMPEEELPDLTGKKGVGLPRLLQRYERWRDSHAGNRRFGNRVATDADAVDAMTDDSDFKDRGVSEAERVARTRAALAGGMKDYGPPVVRLPSEAGDTSAGGVDMPGFDPIAYLAALEKRHGLPDGLLRKVWRRESNEGDPRFMRSPRGAMGHFGFMPKTAKEYGLKDPDDFKESADASARKWHDLLSRYKGDVRLAAAAYNWGDGNLERYGLGRAPQETRGYMDAVAGNQSSVSIEANPQINIYGVSDPRAAAERVVEQQRTVNADITRNFSPKVR